jgi:hypothetical protein
MMKLLYFAELDGGSVSPEAALARDLVAIMAAYDHAGRQHRLYGSCTQRWRRDLDEGRSISPVPLPPTQVAPPAVRVFAGDPTSSPGERWRYSASERPAPALTSARNASRNALRSPRAEGRSEDS